jgi:hypothetical protein
MITPHAREWLSFDFRASSLVPEERFGIRPKAIKIPFWELPDNQTAI